jgi:hypothetical protein
MKCGCWRRRRSLRDLRIAPSDNSLVGSERRVEEAPFLTPLRDRACVQKRASDTAPSATSRRVLQCPVISSRSANGPGDQVLCVVDISSTQGLLPRTPVQSCRIRGVHDRHGLAAAARRAGKAPEGRRGDARIGGGTQAERGRLGHRSATRAADRRGRRRRTQRSMTRRRRVGSPEPAPRLHRLHRRHP